MLFINPGHLPRLHFYLPLKNSEDRSVALNANKFQGAGVFPLRRSLRPFYKTFYVLHNVILFTGGAITVIT